MADFYTLAGVVSRRVSDYCPRRRSAAPSRCLERVRCRGSAHGGRARRRCCVWLPAWSSPTTARCCSTAWTSLSRSRRKRARLLGREIVWMDRAPRKGHLAGGTSRAERPSPDRDFAFGARTTRSAATYTTPAGRGAWTCRSRGRWSIGCRCPTRIPIAGPEQGSRFRAQIFGSPQSDLCPDIYNPAASAGVWESLLASGNFCSEWKASG
jgi:hypothetical protein